jgi:hypothetical protein
MSEADELRKIIKRQRRAEERRHRELLDALRGSTPRTASEARADTRAKMREGFEENDRRVRESGARSPREQRVARREARDG